MIDKTEGVGFMTAVSIIAETNGFALIENTKQLASYPSIDVVYIESGLKRHNIYFKKGEQIFASSCLYACIICLKVESKIKATLRSFRN